MNSSRESKKDNLFLYAVRCIAALFVIVIHTRFPGKAGEILDALARFAVPFFFALSGRFLLGLKDETPPDIRKKTGRTLGKILAVTAKVYLIYTIFSLIYHLINKESIAYWFTSKYNPEEAKWFLLFNSGRFIYDGSYTFDHLWYLFALIYVLILIYIFAPVLRKWYKGLIVILLFFLYFGEALQTYYPIRPFGINICTWYVMRNWLFVGMPFVLIGILFSDYVQGKKKKLGEDEYEKMLMRFKSMGLMLLGTGILLTIVENSIWGKKEVYIGSLLMVGGILFLSESLKTGLGIIWKIGKRAASNIYFYHVLIIAIFDFMVAMGVFMPLPMWAKPLLIMAVCILLFFAVPEIIEAKRGKE